MTRLALCAPFAVAVLLGLYLLDRGIVAVAGTPLRDLIAGVVLVVCGAGWGVSVWDARRK